MRIQVHLKNIIKDALQLFLSPQRYVWRMKQVSSLALTFDDGPDPVITPILLDILKENQVLCTFFVIGEKAAKYPDIIKRIATEGHELGNHTYSHKILPSLSKREIKEEILKVRSVLFKIIGKEINLFRPPQTRMNFFSFWMLNKLNQTVVLWSICSEDYLDQGINRIFQNVNDRNVQGGDILLFHDYSDDTKKALPLIIKNLKNAGFTFCTVSTLLKEANKILLKNE